MINQNDVARKLRSKLIANSTIVSLTQGVYFANAPQNQAYPYISFFPVSGVPIQLQQGSGILNMHAWQIDIWGQSALTVNQIHTQIATTLDNNALGLGSLSEIALRRSSILPLMIEATEQGGNVFHQPLEYVVYSR